MDWYRHLIHRLVYVTAAAACILLIFAIFLFNNKQLAPEPQTTMAQNPSGTKWISHLDKGLLSLDTEIEINRRLISISGQDNVDYEKILFPEVEPEVSDDYPVDEDYLL